MKQKTRWLARWASFLTGVCIGLLIVAPVVALAELPFADHGLSPRLLEYGQALIDAATMLLSVILIRRIASRPLPTRFGRTRISIPRRSSPSWARARRSSRSWKETAFPPWSSAR